jgi:hypothetical protein
VETVGSRACLCTGRSCKWKHELWPELQARWEKFRKSGEAAAAAAAARRPRLSPAKPAVSVLPPRSLSRGIPCRPASDAPKPRRSDPRRDKPRAKKGRAGPHPAASSASASASAPASASAAALPAATTLHLPDTRAFWAAAAERVPAAARYDARRVEAAARGLEGSLLVAPHDRVEWFPEPSRSVDRGGGDGREAVPGPPSVGSSPSAS